MQGCRILLVGACVVRELRLRQVSVGELVWMCVSVRVWKRGVARWVVRVMGEAGRCFLVSMQDLSLASVGCEQWQLQLCVFS